MKLAFQLLAVAVAYGVAGVLMYRQRIIGAGVPWDFDLVISGMALIANGWIVGKSLPSKWRLETRSAATCAIGLLLTFLAFLAYMVVALNTYGS